VNWNKITKYAAALLAAQVVIGFLEGSLAPTRTSAGIALLFVSSAASFLVCGAIFAHFAARQPSRPFAHAWASLLLQVAVAAVLWQVLARGLGTVPLQLLALEWLVLTCSLLVGTSVGASHRRSTGQRAGA
jgi:hypothetical protein